MREKLRAITTCVVVMYLKNIHHGSPLSSGSSYGSGPPLFLSTDRARKPSGDQRAIHTAAGAPSRGAEPRSEGGGEGTGATTGEERE